MREREFGAVASIDGRGMGAIPQIGFVDGIAFEIAEHNSRGKVIAVKLHHDRRRLDHNCIPHGDCEGQALRVGQDREFDSAVRACDLNFLHVNALRSSRPRRLRLGLRLSKACLRKAKCRRGSKNQTNKNRSFLHNRTS